MKLLSLIFTFTILSTHTALAKIRNGYLDIENAREALRSLEALKYSGAKLSVEQSRRVNGRARLLRDHVIHFELTEKLLQQFRIISPEIYDELDSIKDKDGKATDVYIRFIPKASADVQHPGITTILYKEGDNTCYSEYGPQTASVKVWIMDTSLTILAHELGHVKYQVPNHAIYDAYHKLTYRAANYPPNFIGHDGNDLSGKSAYHFEGKFIDHHRIYKRSATKEASPFKVLAEIKKRTKETQSIAIVD